MFCLFFLVHLHDIVKQKYKQILKCIHLNNSLGMLGNTFEKRIFSYKYCNFVFINICLFYILLLIRLYFFT